MSTKPTQTAPATPEQSTTDANFQAIRQRFAQSLPIDTLARYKDALGDPQKMTEFAQGLTPGQTNMLKQIQSADMGGLGNGFKNLAYLTGAISIFAGGMENVLGGVNNAMNNAMGLGAAAPVIAPTAAAPTLGTPKPVDPMLTPRPPTSS